MAVIVSLAFHVPNVDEMKEKPEIIKKLVSKTKKVLKK
jgi:uncharacterized protein YlxP (DUF503 family)